MRISDWSSDVCSSDLAYQDLSDTAAWYVMILVVDDAQIDAGYRAAGRSQKTCTVVLVLEDRHNGGAFGLAVGLCEARVWQRRQRPEKRRLADRRSAICYIPNLRDRKSVV